jgi:hypothetical protein
VSKKVMKLCDKCGKHIVFDDEIWRKMETANGKHFTIRHDKENCGGYFVLPVSDLIRKVG